MRRAPGSRWRSRRQLRSCAPSRDQCLPRDRRPGRRSGSGDGRRSPQAAKLLPLQDHEPIEKRIQAQADRSRRHQPLRNPLGTGRTGPGQRSAPRSAGTGAPPTARSHHRRQGTAGHGHPSKLGHGPAPRRDHPRSVALSMDAAVTASESQSSSRHGHRLIRLCPRSR
jgi:hypothetical protein